MSNKELPHNFEEYEDAEDLELDFKEHKRKKKNARQKDPKPRKSDEKHDWKKRTNRPVQD